MEEAGLEVIGWIGSKREYKITKAFHFIFEIVNDNQRFIVDGSNIDLAFAVFLFLFLFQSSFQPFRSSLF
jgi:hypothetical protein